MTLPYTRGEELRDRYQDSIIYLNGQPIYVCGVTGENTILLGFYTLPFPITRGPVVQSIEASDSGLTDAVPTLGYMNGVKVLEQGGEFEAATFVQRMPVRRSKQGLDQGNLYFPPGVPMNLGYALKAPGFVHMLTNNYPPYLIAKEQVVSQRKSLQSLAFHKNFCLEFNHLDLFVLSYKGKQIGSSQHGGGFQLAGQMKYLTETLSDLGVKAA